VVVGICVGWRAAADAEDALRSPRWMLASEPWRQALPMTHLLQRPEPVGRPCCSRGRTSTPSIRHQQLGRFTQGSRQSDNVHQTNVALASLDRANVGAMQPRPLSQILLGQLVRDARHTKPPTELDRQASCCVVSMHGSTVLDGRR
jgi:hypothetical protein